MATPAMLGQHVKSKHQIIVKPKSTKITSITYPWLCSQRQEQQTPAVKMIIRKQSPMAFQFFDISSYFLASHPSLFWIRGVDLASDPRSKFDIFWDFNLLLSPSPGLSRDCWSELWKMPAFCCNTSCKSFQTNNLHSIWNLTPFYQYFCAVIDILNKKFNIFFAKQFFSLWTID